MLLFLNSLNVVIGKGVSFLESTRFKKMNCDIMIILYTFLNIVHLIILKRIILFTFLNPLNLVIGKGVSFLESTRCKKMNCDIKIFHEPLVCVSKCDQTQFYLVLFSSLMQN